MQVPRGEHSPQFILLRDQHNARQLLETCLEQGRALLLGTQPSFSPSSRTSPSSSTPTAALPPPTEAGQYLAELRRLRWQFWGLKERQEALADDFAPLLDLTDETQRLDEIIQMLGDYVCDTDDAQLAALIELHIL